MKKLLTLAMALYAFNLTGCATMDTEDSSYHKKIDNDYQAKLEQQRYDKMLGKTTFCTPQVGYRYEGKDGKPVPDFKASSNKCY